MFRRLVLVFIAGGGLMAAMRSGAAQEGFGSLKSPDHLQLHLDVLASPAPLTDSIATWQAGTTGPAVHGLRPMDAVDPTAFPTPSTSPAEPSAGARDDRSDWAGISPAGARAISLLGTLAVIGLCRGIQRFCARSDERGRHT